MDGEYNSRTSLTSVRAQDSNTYYYANTHSNCVTRDVLRLSQRD